MLVLKLEQSNILAVHVSKLARWEAYNEDLDLLIPIWATLFAQACLTQYLGLLQYL